MAAQVVTLSDPASGSTAKVLVSTGLNCYQFQVPGSGDPVDIIWSEPGFEQGERRAAGSGIPILFPFPGRIAGTSLSWEGKTYPLEPGDGRGNAIHGFVHERPWRILEQSAQRLVGQFHAAQDDPQLLKHWPADFRITASHDLQGTCLGTTLRFENPGDVPLPCGLGTHPYFQLPLGGNSAEACRVKLPVAGTWELNDMNATGAKTSLPNAARFQNGQPFGTLTLDTVFTDLVFHEKTCRAEIRDPETGRHVTLTFDRTFRECVVYTPPHREAICIEPYTCVPDAFRLEQAGHPAGLRVLAPGESVETRIEIRVH